MEFLIASYLIIFSIINLCYSNINANNPNPKELIHY